MCEEVMILMFTQVGSGWSFARPNILHSGCAMNSASLVVELTYPPIRTVTMNQMELRHTLQMDIELPQSICKFITI